MPWPSERTTNDQHCIKIHAHWSWRIPNWLSASGLAIGKKSTILHQCKQFILLDFSGMSWQPGIVLHRFTLKALALPKPVWPDRQAYPWLGQEQASHPKKTVRGILDMTCYSCFQPQRYKTRLPFGSAFSYSRKPSLFGLVDYQSHQAWVLVSTISRLTYMRWQHSFPLKVVTY